MTDILSFLIKNFFSNRTKEIFFKKFLHDPETLEDFLLDLEGASWQPENLTFLHNLLQHAIKKSSHEEQFEALKYISNKIAFLVLLSDYIYEGITHRSVYSHQGNLLNIISDSKTSYVVALIFTSSPCNITQIQADFLTLRGDILKNDIIGVIPKIPTIQSDAPKGFPYTFIPISELNLPRGLFSLYNQDNPGAWLWRGKQREKINELTNKLYRDISLKPHLAPIIGDFIVSGKNFPIPKYFNVEEIRISIRPNCIWLSLVHNASLARYSLACWSPQTDNLMYVFDDEQATLLRCILLAMWYDAISLNIFDESTGNNIQSVNPSSIITPSRKPQPVVRVYLPRNKKIYRQQDIGYGQKSPHTVEFHLRRLPPGHEASDDARRNAALYNVNIPPGYTFVIGYSTTDFNLSKFASQNKVRQVVFASFRHYSNLLANLI